MGAKKEPLILKAIAERRQHVGRHLLAETATAAEALVAYLQTHAPDAADRRGRQPAARRRDLRRPRHPGVPARPAASWTPSRATRRSSACSARGDTKSSVLLWKRISGRPAAGARRNRAAPRCSTSPARRRTTSRCASARSIAAHAERVRPVPRTRRPAKRAAPAQTEDGVSPARSDLAPGSPTRALRENRGEIDAAAAANALPRLIALGRSPRRSAHAHDRDRRPGRHRDDGARRRATPAATTSPSPITASRWRWPTASTSARALAHAARIREINARIDGITVLAGIECDIRPDGTMDLADDCLAAARLRRRLGPLRRSTRSRRR